MDKAALIIAIFSLFSLQFLSLIARLIKMNIERKKRRYTGRRTKEDEDKLTLKEKLQIYKRFIFKESGKGNLFIAIRAITVVIVYFISMGNYLLGVVSSILLPILYYGYIIRTAKPVLEKREQILTDMIDLKRSKMKLKNPKSNAYNYDEEFEVLEWDEEKVKPVSMRIFLPVDFDEIFAENFLQFWSNKFGENAAWGINVEDEETGGWNMAKGVASIKQVEPLPEIAMWDEFYVNNPDIAWSFFPLGLSINGGVLLTNPKTGEKEHVVGLDLNGDQSKLAKKRGLTIGPEVVRSPQTLIAGLTGGGKALDLDTYVYVLVDENEKLYEDDILVDF